MPAALIKQQLTDAMKAALKGGDKPRLGAIRLILADFKRIEVDERIEIDDARALVILDKMLKQRRDSLAQYEQAGRQELADQEAFEITVIEDFLPAALSDDEIATLINDAIDNTGATAIKDMGAVMAQLKPQLQGRADMAKVSQQVRARLG